MSQDSEEPNIAQALGFLRRRGLWIVLCFVLASAAAFGLSKHQTKKYTATASVAFNNNQLSQEIAGLSSSSNNLLLQQASNLELLHLGDMAAKTASILGHGLTEEKVSDSLSIGGQPESSIASVSVTTTSPELAAEIANTYARQFVNEQENANRQYFRSALALVKKQLAALSPQQRVGTDGLNLQDRAQSLELLVGLQPDTVQVAQHALVPATPSSPKTSRNTLIGALLGLLLGLGLALLLDRLDPRIREPKDLESIYGLPLLGEIPESDSLSRSALRGQEKRRTLPPREAEAFDLVRAHLRYFNVGRELRTLLVASAAQGEGKTTVARHLAAAASRMGSRVLLMEVDLRRPTLAQQLNISSGPGLSDVLLGAASTSEATQTIDFESLSGDGRRELVLDVLVAGAVPPPNPSELIESHAMENVLEQVKSMYDLVVIDTLPLTAVSDAFPLLSKVDGVIIVGRVGRNRRDVAERLRQVLDTSGAPLMGVIANGVKSSRRNSSTHTYSSAKADNLATPGVSADSAPVEDEFVSGTKT